MSEETMAEKSMAEEILTEEIMAEELVAEESMVEETTSCTCSKPQAAERLKQRMDKVADDMMKGVEETSIVQALSRLLQQHEKLEVWRHSSSRLNLLQLAVLHGRTHVIEYLCGRHGSFMERDLYKGGVGYWQQKAVCSCFQRSKTSSQSQALPPLTHQQPSPEQSSEEVHQQPPEQSSGEEHQQPSPEQSSEEHQQPSPEQSSEEEHQQQPPEQSPGQAHQASGDASVTPVKDGEHQQNGEIMLNHPLHMACLLGDLDSLKALTKLVVNRAHRSRFRPQSSGSDTEGQAAQMLLQALMKTVGVITTDVSPSRESAEGLPLELAVNSGSVACVTFILRNILWRWVSSQYYFLCMELWRRAVILHLACCFSAPRLVAMLLPSLPGDVMGCRDAQGQMPLHMAVWSGDTDTIRLLLEHGADVNALTSSSSSCLHILFRSKLMPCQLEANTKLLLKHGADINVSDHHTFTPLHVLAEEIVQANNGTLQTWKRKSAERLAVYARSKWGANPVWTTRDHCQSLVRCLRLLLEAGADPCHLDGPPPQGRNALQRVLSIKSYFLASSYPDILFSVMVSLLEFGATISCSDDCGRQELGHFLTEHVPRMQQSDRATWQARFVQLLSENGVDPDDMGQVFLHSLGLATGRRAPQDENFTWTQSFWTCLADRMSLEGLRTLPAIISLLQPAFPDWIMGALYGSPVRTLRHSAKVVVWKCLGFSGGRVDSLRVPNMVKSYLKSCDL
ncbi:uncharacterized protein LOC143293527 [Babylonia areolata]|uniref:uncharacterized protein LOC143293527 n=1 Tax=Babylonia areolata TaxID=304850 RepID=UPI003FD68E2C